MTDGIRLAADLVLPVDAVTQTFAVLAKRGVGKSTTARKLAEGFAASGCQFVAVDPVGVWWGLRSSADGAAPGLDIYIFGGERGDLPIEEASGALMADVVMDSGASVVFDLSEMTEAGMRRFMADFCTRLYQAKATDRRPLHLILDEADEFAPQRIRPDGAKLFGAIDRIVRRGRARGLGVTLISQRPAVVNKDVLTQCEVLVAMRVTHPRDRKALEEWATAHDGSDLVKQFADSLTSLDVGEAWVWSPGWLDVFQRVRIELPWTFDSSYTPKAGEERAEPTARTPIDLDALGARIQSTREQAAANDPKALRTRIRELEAWIQSGDTSDLIEARAEIERLQREHDFLEAEVARRGTLLARAEAVIRGVSGLVAEYDETNASDADATIASSEAVKPVRAVPPLSRPEAAPVGGKAPAPAPAPRSTDGSEWSALSKAQRSILGVLAQFPDGLEQAKVALLSGYTDGSGGFNNAVSALRSTGLIEGGRSHLRITASGDAVAAGNFVTLPTGYAALEYWCAHQAVRKVSAAPRLLRALSERWPEWVTLDELATVCGYSPGTGGFNNGCSRLRSLGLAESEPGRLRAASLFFEDGL